MLTSGQVPEVLPKQGLFHQENIPTMVLCKPKLVPLKSVTLEKMETMQREAQEIVKAQEKEAQFEAQLMHQFGGLPLGGARDLS